MYQFSFVETPRRSELTDRNVCNSQFTWCFHKPKLVLYSLRVKNFYFYICLAYATNCGRQAGSSLMRYCSRIATACSQACFKGHFPLRPYRSKAYRVSLYREHSGRTNNVDTIEYATFRYDMIRLIWKTGLNLLRTYPLLIICKFLISIAGYFVKRRCQSGSHVYYVLSL